MTEDRVLTRSEILCLEDLTTEFLSLRVGEEILRLEIQEIRKVINRNKQDNLAGVDYKYIITTKDNKVLRINSWLLWKKIAAALQEAGTIQAVLKLRHTGIEEYSVKVL